MPIILNDTQISGIVDPANGDYSDKVVTTKYMEINATRPNITWINPTGHNCVLVLTDDGTLYSTSGTAAAFANGTTGRGLSGNGFQTYGLDYLIQVPVPTTNKIIQAGGGNHGFAFALDSAGNLYTWGTNTNGQCGNATAVAIPTPVLVQSGVVKVYDDPSGCHYDVNQNRIFILKNDGFVYGSGYNAQGALGINSITNPNAFTKVLTTGGVSFAANAIKSLWNLGSTYGITVIQTTDNHIWVAGYNATYALGNGLATNSSVFVDTSGAWNGGDYNYEIMKVGGAYGYFDTALSATCTTVMWLRSTTTGADLIKTCGSNNWGSIGNGTLTTPVTIPYTVNISALGVGSIQDVAISGHRATIHVLKSDGTLIGWGHNQQGQLGVNTIVDVSTPTIITTTVTKMFHHGWGMYNYGYRFSSFIQKTDGYIYGCGYNGWGELGNGNATATNQFILLWITDYVRPNSIKFMGMYPTVVAEYMVMAVTTDNTIYGWGYNAQNILTTDSTLQSNYPLNFTINPGHLKV